MSFGLHITANDGSLLISPDSRNYRLLGPITCSAAASPTTSLMEASATHKCTFTSNNHPPLVYVDLPATTSNGNGAAIVGMTRSGSSYTVYVLSVGHTPSIYYAADFTGAVLPAHGMAIFDTNAALIWENDDAMHSSDFIDWSSDRVSTFVPNTLSRSAYAIGIPTKTGTPIAGFCVGYETTLLDLNMNLTWATMPVYSLYPGGNYIFVYPATVKISMGALYTRLAVYDAGTEFSLSYNAYYNTSQPVNRGAFLLR